MQPKKKLKLLFAEDQEAIAIGVKNALEESPILFNYDHARYCDDAWLKLKKAEYDQEPYDVLITDLSFKPDHREVKLKDGKDLIKAVRKESTPYNIIVFSVEDKPLKVQKLFDQFKIDAYVCKGRQDNKEIIKAIQKVQNGETYISEEARQQMHLQKNLAQVREIDQLIVELLCKGFSQEQISIYLKEKGISPNSISWIEKELKYLRETFSAKTNIELAIIFKDMGLV